jgi:hypothetical protein
MASAIHTGLTYGLIAGFGLFSFALTLMLLWLFIECIDYILNYNVGDRSGRCGSKDGDNL